MKQLFLGNLMTPEHVFFCHCYFHFQGQLQDYSTKRESVKRPAINIRVMQSAGLLYHEKRFCQWVMGCKARALKWDSRKEDFSKGNEKQITEDL